MPGTTNWVPNTSGGVPSTALMMSCVAGRPDLSMFVARATHSNGDSVVAMVSSSGVGTYSWGGNAWTTTTYQILTIS